MGKNKGLKPQKDHVAVFSADYDSSVKIQGQGGESYLEIANHHNKTGDKKNSWGIGTNDDSKLHFSYGANGTMNKSDKIVINKAGHVGIGTSNPDTRNGWNKVLEVQGGPHAKTLVTTRNNKVKMGTYAHQNWGGPSGSVGTESNHDLRLLTNYNEKMRIKANGHVGVGTSNPQEKLDVNGTIRIHGSNGKFSAYGDNSRVASKKEYIQFVKTDNSTDGARLYAEGSANQGKLVLGITDDLQRQEAFIIRSEHYRGGVKNIAEFTGDGNVTVNGNLNVNGKIEDKS